VDTAEEMRNLLAVHNTALGSAASVHRVKVARITTSIPGLDGAAHDCVGF
jgi:hypothetical protein